MRTITQSEYDRKNQIACDFMYVNVTNKSFIEYFIYKIKYENKSENSQEKSAALTMPLIFCTMLLYRLASASSLARCCK